MKTMEKMNKTSFRLDSKNLEEKVNETIELIQKISDLMGYRISNIDKLKEEKFDKLKTLSNNQRKKIRNLILMIDRKRTLRSFNKFLHHLCKNVLEVDYRVNIKISEKEEKLNNMRKQWKIARDKYELLLDEFKEERGDFYKEKSSKSELIKTF